MALTKITDHERLARADLLEQFKGLPNIEAILDVVSTKVQEIEEAFWQLLLERFLPTAIGVQLDMIGRIVLRDRANLVDDVYRAVLRGKIAANLSSGTHPEVLHVVELCIDSATTGAVAEVVLEYPAGATIRVTADPLVADLGPHVADLITIAESSGVRILFQYYETDPPFAFDGFGSAKFDGGYYFATTIEGAY